MSAPFRDRRDAGRRLGERLAGMRLDRPIVAGIPRGGVVVAAEVAAAIGAPMDIVVVGRLSAGDGVAVGAVSEGGVRVETESLVRVAGLSREELGRLVASEMRSLSVEAQRYRSVCPQLPFREHTVLIVDDGLTTGSTVQAAARSAFGRGAMRLVLGVPVSSQESLEAVRHEFDDVVCLETPPLLLTLDEWYSNSREVTTEEVVELLERARG